jgi:hypothetical protein
MNDPVITSIRYSSGPLKKKPKAGDERYLKGRAVHQVRQQVKIGGAYLVSNGRPVWEWVDKGSERDRSN